MIPSTEPIDLYDKLLSRDFETSSNGTGVDHGRMWGGVTGTDCGAGTSLRSGSAARWAKGYPKAIFQGSVHTATLRAMGYAAAVLLSHTSEYSINVDTTV